ncbi:MAG: AAA family ATPase [Halioglobus sp.]|nr:AAA family ATPase [Halioglobus sp.]
MEEHPSLGNLLGRIEHRTEMGTLITDFMLIKPGALHRANGGYIMLDARKLLTEPFAWEALKRTLRGNAIRIETMAEQLGSATTVTLEPQPVPLDLKVILMGERFVYDLLVHRDPDFGELFKVEADFEDRWVRSADNERQLAQLVTSIVQVESYARCTRAARRGLSSRRRDWRMTRSACHSRSTSSPTYCARRISGPPRGEATIGAAHVQRALDARIHRRDRMRERVYEAIQRETLLIDTSGEAVGQINGLAVTGIGDFFFGTPSRITARVRVGSGKVIDIEREVELGGPLHSKGVMILRELPERAFCPGRPAVAVGERLVFEQSYGGVDGDSAIVRGTVRTAVRRSPACPFASPSP